MQEKSSNHQVQAFVREPCTQKLGMYPPLGQPRHT